MVITYYKVYLKYDHAAALILVDAAFSK